MDPDSQCRIPDGWRNSNRYIKAHSRKEKVQNDFNVKPILNQKLWEDVKNLELLMNNRKPEQSEILL